MNIANGLETKRISFFYKFSLLVALVSALLSWSLKLVVSRRLRRQGASISMRRRAEELPRARGAGGT